MNCTILKTIEGYLSYCPPSNVSPDSTAILWFVVLIFMFLVVRFLSQDLYRIVNFVNSAGFNRGGYTSFEMTNV